MKILFVCLGNICRSPAAEAILRSLIKKEGLSDKITVMSCGIGDWLMGEKVDVRMVQAASKRGFELSGQAKKFSHNFFDEFDYILAADEDILTYLLERAKKPHQSKLHLMTAFGKKFRGMAIPDPYYHGENAFDNILDMIEDACRGFMNEIKKS